MLEIMKTKKCSYNSKKATRDLSCEEYEKDLDVLYRYLPSDRKK